MFRNDGKFNKTRCSSCTHTHTHQIIMQIFLEYQAIVPTDFPRNVTTLRSPHFSFVRSFYALFTRPYILPTLLGIVIVSFYCLHLLSLNCFTEIICAVHNTVWYDLPFKSVEEWERQEKSFHNWLYRIHLPFCELECGLFFYSHS